MIIGLSGYAQSGKDTVANILVDKFGYKRIAFADRLRELVFEIDSPIPMENGDKTSVVGLQNIVEELGWEDAKKVPYVRTLLQNTGVAVRKVFGDQFWVYEALSEVAPQDKVVVSDVRFKNEADFITTFGGQLWRVERPGIEAVNGHVSESDMNGYPVDQTLFNSGTLEDLELLVKTRMQSYL